MEGSDLAQFLAIAAEHLAVIGIIEVEPEDHTIRRVDDGASPVLYEWASLGIARPGAQKDLVAKGLERGVLISHRGGIDIENGPGPVHHHL